MNDGSKNFLQTFLFPSLSSFENVIFKSTYVPLHTKGARLHRQCHPYLTSPLTVTGISLLRVLWKVESAGSKFWTPRVKHPLGRVRNFSRISTFDNVIFPCSNMDYPTSRKYKRLYIDGGTSNLLHITDPNPLRVAVKM